MTRPVDDSFAQGLVGVTLDGRYRLDAVLGEGGMGSVFRATQLAMERKVAVKLLKPHLTSDKAALERFAREARATLKVDSPHAVKILDFGVTPVGDYYMVLEYLDGRTVQRELEIDGPFAPARVAHIARQALHALGAAHAQGLIHRDVKPDNLLLMRAGADGDYTKVLDFGVAKLMQGAAGDPAQLALTAAGMVFGTPEFMSPEQACGQPLDGRSDLYSLAATMFVMLTGTGLFEAGTAIEWLTHHARTPAPLLAIVRPELAVYPELDALLQRCLAKHREQRPATAAEMARLLAELEPALVRRSDAAPTPLASKPTPSRPSAYVPVLREAAANSTAAVAVSGPAPAAPAAPAIPAPAAHAAPVAAHAAPVAAHAVPVGANPPAYAAGNVAPSARRAAPVDTNPLAHARHVAALSTALGVAPSSGSAVTLEATAPPRRRRLALWLGGIAIASVVGIAAGLSLHRPGGDGAGGNGAAATTAPDRASAAQPTDAGASDTGPTRPSDVRVAVAALPIAGTPSVDAGAAPADARVAVAALPVADAPPDASVAAIPVHPAPPAPPARPLPAAAPRNPAAEEHLRAAEDALQTNHPLRQLAEADLALRANPRSARARYLLGDALIKSGDLDRGCSYLAQLRHLAVARDRARAAGCPSD